MRKFFIIAFSVLLIGCSKNVQHHKDIYSKIQPLDLTLKTTDSSLINNFKQAKLLADSMIVTIFDSDTILSQFNIRYGFLYDNWMKSPADSLVGKPEKYEFLYNLKLNDDTILTSASIEIDTLNRILACDFPMFIGLKKINNRELKIDQAFAKTIGLENGLSSDKLIILFRNKRIDEKSMPNIPNSFRLKEFKTYLNYIQDMKYMFYWYVKNDCNDCPWIMVDAETGQIFDKGKVRYIY
ncbi:MAG TPA: hypothetical protein VFK73_02335 [Paludibacter sp.]|nr:hypothetical protein [Paludibacter sp.]